MASLIDSPGPKPLVAGPFVSDDSESEQAATIKTATKKRLLVNAGIRLGPVLV